MLCETIIYWINVKNHRYLIYKFERICSELLGLKNF